MRKPRWISLFRLAMAYVEDQGDGTLVEKFTAAYKDRLKTGPYESACWGALAHVKLKEQATYVKKLVLAGPLRVLSDSSVDLDLGNSPLQSLLPRALAETALAERKRG